MSRLSETLKLELFDFDPGATVVTAVEWVDMQEFSKLMVAVMRTIGTSAITLTINASADSGGAGSVVVKTHDIAAEPDSVGDYLILDIVPDEIIDAGAANSIDDLRYVSAVISFATGTDEAAVSYVREGRHCFADLSSDVVA